MRQISEVELILPSLFIMSLNNGIITTSSLIMKLREILNPQGEDIVLLKGRTDDKFSQKVRNLSSHRTFEKYKYAVYDSELKAHQITEHGTHYLKNNLEVLNYILNNNFQYIDVIADLSSIIQKTSKDIELKTEPFEENIVISEGIQKSVESKIYERSNKLRKYAIEYFANDGIIECTACNFAFEKFYGSELGKDFIEIHHIKPIYQYEGDDTNKTIEKALQNLVPLCSNCHRMIHRKRNVTLDVAFLRSAIAKTGSKIVYTHNKTCK